MVLNSLTVPGLEEEEGLETPREPLLPDRVDNTKLDGLV